MYQLYMNTFAIHTPLTHFVVVDVYSCVISFISLKHFVFVITFPGTRMKQNTDCKDPTCEQCGDLEYQDGYTKENKCKPQPICDTSKSQLKIHSVKKNTEHGLKVSFLGNIVLD